MGAVALAAGGGLVLTGSTVAPWVRQSTTRTVGDVAVPQDVAVPGTELAAPLLAVGLAALIAALALMVLPRAARWLVGWALLALGAGGAVVVVDGLWRAAALDGRLGTGPGAGALGALLVLAGGVAVVRRPREGADLPPRHSPRSPHGDPGQDRSREDDEWRLASVEDDG